MPAGVPLFRAAPGIVPPTVGEALSLPLADGTEQNVEWNQLPQLPLGFSRGEAVTMKYRHFGTDILS